MNLKFHSINFPQMKPQHPSNFSSISVPIQIKDTKKHHQQNIMEGIKISIHPHMTKNYNFLPTFNFSINKKLLPPH